MERRRLCVTSTTESVMIEVVRNYRVDEGGPLGMDLQECVPNRLRPLGQKPSQAKHWRIKRAEQSVQVANRKWTAREPSMRCRKRL